MVFREVGRELRRRRVLRTFYNVLEGRSCRSKVGTNVGVYGEDQDKAIVYGDVDERQLDEQRQAVVGALPIYGHRIPECSPPAQRTFASVPSKLQSHHIFRNCTHFHIPMSADHVSRNNSRQPSGEGSRGSEDDLQLSAAYYTGCRLYFRA